MVGTHWEPEKNEKMSFPPPNFKGKKAPTEHALVFPFMA
jgi:hypothetical protein